MIWVPDGPLPDAVTTLIDAVNGDRKQGYCGAWDGPSYYPDPITKTAADVIAGAYELLAAPPRPVAPEEDFPWA